MRGRIFWLALFLIGISWILNSFYAHSKQLVAPIFLDHYIAQPVYDEDSSYITLYYLTNRNDDSHLSYVNFGGITGYVVRDDFFDDFGFYENKFNPDLQTFAHYSLRSLRIELNSYELEEALKENDELIVHDIELFIFDGQDITVPIGEVVLHQNYQSENPLQQWGSSSGDNWNILTYRADEALNIDRITFNFGDVLQDQFSVNFDSTKSVANLDHMHEDISTNDWRDTPGIDIQDVKFPYELKKDEYFTLYTQTSPDFIGYLESSFVITGSTESGKPFTSHSIFHSQQPYLEQKDVDRIIQERGVSK